ncbi:MAG TPA: hypothetical protein VFM10_13705 [Terriglobales bacterium]|nr:hypothetical protein [Terriglobales bacterium]
MEADFIMVAVLTTLVVGWLVWVELRSRRNQAQERKNQKAAEQPANASLSKTDSGRVQQHRVGAPS